MRQPFESSTVESERRQGAVRNRKHILGLSILACGLRYRVHSKLPGTVGLHKSFTLNATYLTQAEWLGSPLWFQIPFPAAFSGTDVPLSDHVARPSPAVPVRDGPVLVPGSRDTGTR